MSVIGNTPTQQSFLPAIEYFNGNGSTTAFTLSRNVVSAAQIMVYIENVPQNPSSAFTVSGNIITFTSAPPTGTSNIWVEYVAINTSSVSPTDGTVQTNSLATSAVTTAKIADANVTQAKLAANVAGTGPAFSAYAGSATTVTYNVFTKIGFDTEEFDTNNNFASSRFTPTVAGYYQLNWNTGVAGNAEKFSILYKNGTAFKGGSDVIGYSSAGSALVYANGSTDYFEVYLYQLGANPTGSSYTGSTFFFSGSLLRTA
jgi:hypothetical protein